MTTPDNLAAELAALRARVEAIEQKLGIKPERPQCCLAHGWGADQAVECGVARAKIVIGPVEPW